MPTMRFTSKDGTKRFLFDSSPARAVGQKMASDPTRFELRNEQTKGSVTTWDVYTIGITEDEKKPLRKFGVLEYQSPVWPGGPPKPWVR